MTRRNQPSFDFLTVGETMIRFSPADGERLETSHAIDMRIGGTESNVAIALSRLGHRAAWSSVLPENALSRRVTGELQRHGVDTSLVHWVDHGRVGIYFIDVAARPRPTTVLYDRADSAIASMDASTFDYSIVRRARHLHLTGITPALGHQCMELTRGLIQEARAYSVSISADINYRALLWPADQARSCLEELFTGLDLLFCGRADASSIWGFTGEPAQIVRQLSDHLRATRTIVTLGDKGSIGLEHGGEPVLVEGLVVDIVDRIGAGDAFAAGVLHAMTDSSNLDNLGYLLRCGNAMAALKMTISGDLAVVTPAELAAILSTEWTSIVR